MNITTDVNTKVDNTSLVMVGVVLACVVCFGILMSKLAK